MKNKQFSCRHRILLLGGAVCIGLIWILCLLQLQGMGIPCLFRQLTGFSCPGCGNSRAALALLQLDISAALACNPMFPLEFCYIGWVVLHCCKSYLNGHGFTYRPPFRWLDIAVLVVILLWCPLRNLWGITL